MKKIALVSCSNPIKEKQKKEIECCIKFLKHIHVDVKLKRNSYQKKMIAYLNHLLLSFIPTLSKFH